MEAIAFLGWRPLLRTSQEAKKLFPKEEDSSNMENVQSPDPHKHKLKASLDQVTLQSRLRMHLEIHIPVEPKTK